MTLHLRDIDGTDVVGSAQHAQHDVLDVQRDVTTLVLRTRAFDTKVIATQHPDGSWELRCTPASDETYTLTCPPDMPYVTLIRLLEIL